MSTKHRKEIWVSPYSEVDRRVPDIGMRVLPGRIGLLSHPINANSEGKIVLAAGDNHTVWICEACGRVHKFETDSCRHCGRPSVTETRKSKGYATDEHMTPDIALVVDSGVERYKKGDVLALRPDTGAFYPAPVGGWGKSGDERELRIVGVNTPWYECVMGQLTEEGFRPADGWCLVKREPKRASIELLEGQYENRGECVSGAIDGDTVVWGPDAEVWAFQGLFDRQYVLVKYQSRIAGFVR